MKLGINGVGRIGRHIFKNLLDKGHDVSIINDINPDIKNVVYTLNYDSLYGKPNHKFQVIDNNTISYGNSVISYSCKSNILNVDWGGIDYVIDSSGIASNAAVAAEVVESTTVKRVFLTNSNDKRRTKRIVQNV